MELIKNQYEFMLIPQHPQRNCIYKEGKTCINLRKDTSQNINTILKFLKDENYPEQNGLVQSNIIVRNHNDQLCIKLMNLWWSMIKKFSKRDQLSFNYCCWKLNIIPTYIKWNQIEQYIHWTVHKKQ